MGGVKGKPTMRQCVCRQCGIKFVGGPRAWYCQECRLDRKRKKDAERHRNGPLRPIGSTDVCTVCGREYTVVGGMQKYCQECAPDALAEIDRRQALEWYADNAESCKAQKKQRGKTKTGICAFCGKEFYKNGRPIGFCSDECRLARKREVQKKSDAARSPRNKNKPDAE